MLRAAPPGAAAGDEILQQIRSFVIEWGTSPQRAENPITWSHTEINT